LAQIFKCLFSLGGSHTADIQQFPLHSGQVFDKESELRGLK